MPEIYIYDEIGPRHWGLVDAVDVIEQLPQSGPVTVRINSPGGDVFNGFAIYNALRRHKGLVTVEIDAVAASAASLIAMAGNTIRIAENAMLMIHEPWTVSAGNAGELRKVADTLDKISGKAAETYAGRSTLELEAITELMADETWFDAAEAIEAGLADEITAPLQIAACLRPWFRNVPKQLQDRGATKVEPVRSASVQKSRIAALRARYAG